VKIAALCLGPMSRTIRRLPYSYIRSFRGRRAALQRGDRRPPPDPWDDYTHSRESLLPWTLAYRLAASGEGVEAIATTLHRKWKIPHRRALEIARRASRRGIWCSVPDGEIDPR